MLLQVWTGTVVGMLMIGGCTTSQIAVTVFDRRDGGIAKATPEELVASSEEYLSEVGIAVGSSNWRPYLLLSPGETASFAHVIYFDAKTTNGWDVTMTSHTRAASHGRWRDSMRDNPAMETDAAPVVLIIDSSGKKLTAHDMVQAARDYLRQHSVSTGMITNIQVEIEVRQEPFEALAGVRLGSLGGRFWLITIGPNGRGTGKIGIGKTPIWP